jgi:hypothetical protein
MLREAFMLVRREWMIVTLLLTAPIPAAAGNVITEWNEKAVGIVQPAAGPLPPLAVRNIAIGRRQDPRVAGERWRVGRRRLPAEDQAGRLYTDTDHLRLAVRFAVSGRGTPRLTNGRGTNDNFYQRVDPRRVFRTAGMGQTSSFVAAAPNGREAPIPAIPATMIEPPGSTLRRPLEGPLFD